VPYQVGIGGEAHEDYIKYLAARYFDFAHSTGVALGPETSR
jgi:hypothetical protein